jgi:hypothetical protein
MPRCFLAAAALVVTALAPARGQEAPSRYVPIPVAGDFESLFKQRLQTAKDVQPFFKFVERIDPEHLKTLLRTLDLENPATRQMLKGMLDKYQGDTKFNPAELAKLTEDIERARWKQLAENLFQAGPAPGTRPPSERSGDPSPPPSGSGPIKAANQRSDLLDEWMKDLARYADDTELADWLKDSAAFQQALGSLRSLENMEADPFGSGFGDISAPLHLADRLNLGIGDGILDRLRDFSLPDLPRVPLPRVSLPRVSLPRVSLAGWGAPSVSLPNLSGARVAETLVWAVIVIVTAMLAWHVAKNAGTRRSHGLVPRSAGPWPVDPSQVATRGQLIQAFEDLAIRTLGAEARSWNHRTIAGELGAASGHHVTAQELAYLYEEARYTAGPDLLDADARRAARRQLCLLAGVPAS